MKRLKRSKETVVENQKSQLSGKQLLELKRKYEAYGHVVQYWIMKRYLKHDAKAEEVSGASSKASFFRWQKRLLKEERLSVG